MSSTCTVYGAFCEPAFVPFPVLNKLHAAKSSATKIASGFMRRVLTYIVASIDSSACSSYDFSYKVDRLMIAWIGTWTICPNPALHRRGARRWPGTLHQKSCISRLTSFSRVLDHGAVYCARCLISSREKNVLYLIGFYKYCKCMLLIMYSLPIVI